MNMVFVYCEAFYFHDFFSDVFIVNFKLISQALTSTISGNSFFACLDGLK